MHNEKLVSWGDFYVSSQAIRSWPMKEAPLVFLSHKVCCELFFYGFTDLVSSAVQGLWEDAPHGLGIPKRRLPLITELGGYPFSAIMNATTLVSPWRKHTSLNNVNSSLQKGCPPRFQSSRDCIWVGGRQRAFKSEIKPLTQPSRSGSLILHEKPDLPRSWLLNSPSHEPFLHPVFPTYILPPYPHTPCPLTQFWQRRKASPSCFFLDPVCACWVGEGGVGGGERGWRSSQIPSLTMNFLKLCYKFCSGFPFHQSERGGGIHCASSEEGLPRPSSSVAFILRTSTTFSTKNATWFSFCCCLHKIHLCKLKCAYTRHCNYVFICLSRL